MYCQNFFSSDKEIVARTLVVTENVYKTWEIAVDENYIYKRWVIGVSPLLYLLFQYWSQL